MKFVFIAAAIIRASCDDTSALLQTRNNVEKPEKNRKRGGVSRKSDLPTLESLLRKEQVLWPQPATVSSGSTSVKIGQLPCQKLGAAKAACKDYNKLLSNCKSVSKADLSCGDVRSPLKFGMDESYSLKVDEIGKVDISANNWVGCVRAITTLKGLVENTEQGNSGKWHVPNAPWAIDDEPKYSYRGVMADTSRHWYSPKSLMQLVDQMFVAKLNVLHLHLTDTGGWSYQVDDPNDELGLVGASIRPGMSYTPEVMRHIIRYAEQRGISVLPELDTPGHAAPHVPAELVRCTTAEFSTTTYGLESPVAQYNIGPDDIATTAQWFEKVWHKTKEIFPNMPFMHFGADEVNVPCMIHGTEHQNATDEEAKQIVDRWQSDWVARMQKIADDLGVPAAMWQDGFLNHEAVEISSGSVLQMWDYNPNNNETKARLIEACKAGTQLVQSRYRTYYMDCGGSNWLFGGDSTWCQFASWNRIYLEHPTDDLPEECVDNVIGASVELWSEAINEHNLLTRAFPRAWALAERLWSDYNGYEDTPNLNQFWDGVANTSWALHPDAQKVWIPALNRMRILQNNQDQAGLASQPLQPEACVVYPELCNVYTDSGR